MLRSKVFAEHATATTPLTNRWPTADMRGLRRPVESTIALDRPTEAGNITGTVDAVSRNTRGATPRRRQHRCRVVAIDATPSWPHPIAFVPQLTAVGPLDRRHSVDVDGGIASVAVVAAGFETRRSPTE